MQNNEICLLHYIGSITAPAGCGKTQLIVSSLKQHEGTKPVLILTHTNAGVTALSERLKKHKVPTSSYKIQTIDGWMLKLVNSFPKRSAISPKCFDLLSPQTDYDEIKRGAGTILYGKHADDIVLANYSHLIVDEYQDCTIQQHNLIKYLATILPTCILGDPLQAIFNFGSNTLVDWNNDVLSFFPTITELNTPWRWINAGASDLGYWLLKIREDLIAGQQIDFTKAPNKVELIPIPKQNGHSKIIETVNKNYGSSSDSILIIGDSRNPQSRHDIAKLAPGSSTVEPVDLRDLLSFADNFDSSPFIQILNFSKSIMTGVGSLNLEQRIKTIQANRHRTPPSNIEALCLQLIQSPSYENTKKIFEELNNLDGVRVFRHEIYYSCIKSLELSIDNKSQSLKESVMKIRERNRFTGRPLPRKAIGSTLLLKGLEAEHVIILNAGTLNAQNLYVAMTRGSKSITICHTSE